MIKVVVVEDSTVQRAHLVRTLEADGDIAVIGEATGAADAVDVITRLSPDVVMLDLLIPGGGGIHVIEQVMAFHPTPIIVLSATLTDRKSEAAVMALVAGAVDALPKPDAWDDDNERELRHLVRVANNVAVVRHPRGRLAKKPPLQAAPTASSVDVPIVAIAASTGGPGAIGAVLSGLAGIAAPVVIVQHINKDFVDGFVSWMARVAAIPVALAVDGERLRAGRAYVAPGGFHIKVGAGGRIALEADPGALHCPSADVLFRSMALHGHGARVGVLLTGMGDDGADGLLELRSRGGVTLAQDEESSVVYGMPRAAVDRGAVTSIVPLEKMAGAIMRALCTRV